MLDRESKARARINVAHLRLEKRFCIGQLLTSQRIIELVRFVPQADTALPDSPIVT